MRFFFGDDERRGDDEARRPLEIDAETNALEATRFVDLEAVTAELEGISEVEENAESGEGVPATRTLETDGAAVETEEVVGARETAEADEATRTAEADVATEEVDAVTETMEVDASAGTEEVSVEVASPPASFSLVAGKAKFEIPCHEVLLGRSPRCEIRIDDPAISRVHLRLESRDEGIWLEDRETRNGTLLDGEPVRSALVFPGQKISIGEVVFGVVPSSGAMKIVASRPKRLSKWFRGWRGWGLLVLGAVLCSLFALVGRGDVEVEEAPPSDEALAYSHFEEGLALYLAGDLVGAEARFELSDALDPSAGEAARYLERLRAERKPEVVQDALVSSEAEEEEGEAAQADALRTDEAFAEQEEGGGEQGKGFAFDMGSTVVPARVTPSPSNRRRPSSKRRAWGPSQEELAEIESQIRVGEERGGLGAIKMLEDALGRLGQGNDGGALAQRARRRLAEVSLLIANEAAVLQDVSRTVVYLQKATAADPSHLGARTRLEALRQEAESIFVEGYALLGRSPEKARNRLEAVMLLTGSNDDLHQRALKWLRTLD